MRQKAFAATKAANDNPGLCQHTNRGASSNMLHGVHETATILAAVEPFSQMTYEYYRFHTSKAAPASLLSYILP